jgi:hypothetical protein
MKGAPLFLSNGRERRGVNSGRVRDLNDDDKEEEYADETNDCIFLARQRPPNEETSTKEVLPLTSDSASNGRSS